MSRLAGTDTNLMAGADCRRLRASAIYTKLPSAAAAVADSLHGADSLLLASNGRDSLLIARGSFHEAPLGGTLLSPSLAIAGSADAVQAAAARYRSHARTAPPAILAHAEPVAKSDLWIAADGTATLTVPGNGENLNRLLHTTRYVTISGHFSDGVTIDLSAVCGSPEPAQKLEETLRAMITLAAAAEARQRPDFADRLRAIPIRREAGTVRITIAATPSDLDQWLRLF